VGDSSVGVSRSSSTFSDAAPAQSARLAVACDGVAASLAP